MITQVKGMSNEIGDIQDKSSESIDEMQQLNPQNSEYEEKREMIAKIIRGITAECMLNDHWRPMFDNIIEKYKENEDYNNGFSDSIRFLKCFFQQEEQDI